MRYAILADIHGNLEALNAVLNALSAERIDAYLSVGDIVGYGADPAACIAALRTLGLRSAVAGNHEWGVLGRNDLGNFNDLAAAAVAWTRTVLSGDDRAYLATLPLTHVEGPCELVHGSLVEPAEFNYVLGAYDAQATIACMTTELCCIGHSHRPAVYRMEGGRAVVSHAPRSRLVPGDRYLINAGSVGQPRDGDARASFVIYDSDTRLIDICRVAYDIAGAQRKILAAGLPRELAARLAEGK